MTKTEDRIRWKMARGENISSKEAGYLSDCWLRERNKLRCCGSCDHWQAGFCLRDDTIVERSDRCSEWVFIGAK